MIISSFSSQANAESRDDAGGAAGLLMIDGSGHVSGYGAARIPGEGLYRADGGTAQCADLDGDGVAGITGLVLEFVEVGTRRPTRMTVVFDLQGQEADARGVYPIRIDWPGATLGEHELRVLRAP